MPSTAPDLERLLSEIRACTHCRDALPLGPRPVLQVGRGPILIVAQAPGTKDHATGVPFNDASGDRLRAWQGVGRDEFYDPDLFCIIPMGFCYPGRAPKGGDLPPRPECKALWHDRLFAAMPPPAMKLVIGQYAHAYHLGAKRKASLTETVRAWPEFAPQIWPMVHPSPRNTHWLQRNLWFEQELIPALQRAVSAHLAAAGSRNR